MYTVSWEDIDSDEDQTEGNGDEKDGNYLAFVSSLCLEASEDATESNAQTDEEVIEEEQSRLEDLNPLASVKLHHPSS